jgi:hypothetical protein
MTDISCRDCGRRLPARKSRDPRKICRACRDKAATMPKNITVSNGLPEPKTAKSTKTDMGALKRSEGTPAYPRINFAPARVLDTEFGFSRKLTPAPSNVIARINRESIRLQRLEAFRHKRVA